MYKRIIQLNNFNYYNKSFTEKNTLKKKFNYYIGLIESHLYDGQKAAQLTCTPKYEVIYSASVNITPSSKGKHTHTEVQMRL